MRKRQFSVFLLVLCLLAGIPAEAEASGGMNQTGTVDVDYYGELWISGGKDDDIQKIPAAVYEEDQILAEASGIAAVTNTTVTEQDGILTFSRNNYHVDVNLETARAKIRIEMPGLAYLNAYRGNFKLKDIHIVKGTQTVSYYLPFTKMLYLLNATWDTSDEIVYLHVPKETLWNLVSEYEPMVKSLPDISELMGEGFEFWLKSAFYGTSAALDEQDLGKKAGYCIQAIMDGVDVRQAVFVESSYDYNKYKEAMLEMAGSYDNFSGSNSSLLAKSVSTLNNFSDAAPHYLTVAQNAMESDKADDFVKQLSERLSKWGKLPGKSKLPKGIDTKTLSKAVSVGKTALDVVNYTTTIVRSLAWTDDYYQQMKVFGDVGAQDSISLAGAALSQEAEDIRSIIAKETVRILIEKGTDAAANALANGISDVYDLSMSSATIALSGYFEAGDAMYRAVKLNYISGYARTLYENSLREAENEKLTEQLITTIWASGFAMVNAAAHCRDDRYSVLLESKKLGASVQTELNAVANLQSENASDVVRFAEAAQYNDTLLLKNNFAGLYSSTDGIYRSRVPETYVHVTEPLFSAYIAEYDGKTYVCGGTVPGLEASPAASPKDEYYLCGMVFYEGRLYFACKTAGTSGYSSAIYSSKPDGSDLDLLAENAQYDTSLPQCTEFMILDGNLYYGFGEACIDLETGKKCATGQNTSEIQELYADHHVNSTRYFQQERYYVPEPQVGVPDRIIRMNIQGEEEELYECTEEENIYMLEAVTANEIYFSTYDRESQEYVLKRLNLKDGKIKVLDQHINAGGGGYFSW